MSPTRPPPRRRPIVLARASDECLVELAREGDERAFESIVERYRPQLLRHARRIAGEHAAEDALQHAFACAWHSLRRGGEIRHVRAWLFAIVRNSALQTIGDTHETTHELAAGGAHVQSVEEEFERATRLRAALSAVAALPLREREALVGTSIDGRSSQDVARELGVAAGAFRQLVFRARAHARAGLAAFATPLLGLRVRVAGGGWSRRMSALAGDSSAPLRELASSAAVASAIVAVGAGVYATGASLLPRAHDPARPPRAAALARTGASPTAATRRDRRAPAGSALARAQVPPRGSNAAAALRSPDDAFAPASGSAHRSSPDSVAPDQLASAGHALGAAGLSAPSAPAVPVSEPQARARAGVKRAAEAAGGAVGAVSGAAGELAHQTGGPQPIEHRVTSVVEPVAPTVGAVLEGVTGR